MNYQLQNLNIIVLFILFFLMFVSVINIRKGFVYYYSCITFVILSGYLASIRSYNYGDTRSYLRYFIDIKDNETFEYGFKVFTEFAQSIDLSFPVYLFIIGAVTAFFYFLAISMLNDFISDSEKNIVTVLVAFSSFCFFQYYYFFFEAVRDGISSSILFLSFVFLAKNKKKHFILFIVFAQLFHKTAIMFFPLLFIFLLEFSRKFYLLSFIVITLLSYFFKTIILSTDIFGPFVGKLLEFYSEDNSGSKTVFIRYLLVLFLSTFFLKRVNESCDRVLRIIIGMVLISSLFYTFPDMYRRLLIKIEYISYPIIISIIMYYFNNKVSKLFLVLFLMVFYVVFLSNYYSYYNLLNIMPFVESF